VLTATPGSLTLSDVTLPTEALTIATEDSGYQLTQASEQYDGLLVKMDDLP
jgi:hypothetical protein